MAASGEPYAIRAFALHYCCSNAFLQRRQCGLYLPVRQWADATTLQQFNRCQTDLPANRMPCRRAINCSDSTAYDTAHRNIIVLSTAGL